MYQPNFPTVPFRLGLYPVVDSVAWIERLLEAGVRTINCVSKINTMTKWKPTLSPPLRWGVVMTPACLSTTTGDWHSTTPTACISARRP